MFIAAQECHEAVVISFIKAGADVHTAPAYGFHVGETPLHIAARNGHGSVVTALVHAGADFNKVVKSQMVSRDEGWTPLYIAARNRHEAAVSALIKSGAVFNGALAPVEFA